MKIQGQEASEPLTCCEGDVEYVVITQLLGASTDSDFYLALRRHTPLPFEHMTQLSDWVRVLNVLDARLQGLLRCRGSDWLISLESTVAEDPTPMDEERMDGCNLESSKSHIVQILQFTSSLLQRSVGKDVYNSAEHLMRLLDAFDSDIAIEALGALCELALPPRSHRSEHYIKRHHTSLHKAPPAASLTFLFDIVELALTSAPAEELKPPQHPIICSSSANALFPGEHVAPLQPIGVNSAMISSDLHTVWQSLDVASWGLWQRRWLLWAIRIQRYLSSDKQSLQIVLLRCVSTLLNCYPTKSVLSAYFHEKVDLLKDVIATIRNPPCPPSSTPSSSLDNTPAAKSQESALIANSLKTDTEIYRLACCCLQSVVETRDFSSPTYLRYPWLLHDLGVHRGQYMGSLPVLLRQYLHSLLELNPVQLVCLESLCDLVVTLAGSTTALPTLVDNGLVPVFVQTIALTPTLQLNEAAEAANQLVDGQVSQEWFQQHVAPRWRPAAIQLVECCFIEIIENAIIHSNVAASSFRDIHGVDLIFARLLFEVVHGVAIKERVLPRPPSALDNLVEDDEISGAICSNTNSFLGSATSVAIQELISLLLSYIQEGRPDQPDSSLQVFYRSKTFLVLFDLIFANYEIFTVPVVASAFSLLIEIIHTDNAPPTIVNYLLSARENHGVALLEHIAALAGKMALKTDLAVLFLNFCSAVSITSAGSNFVLQSKILDHVIGMTLNDMYYLPYSRIAMHELTSNMANSLEEMVRHFPVYLPVVMTNLLACLRSVHEMFEKFGDQDIDDRYLLIYYKAFSLTNILESILVRPVAVHQFIQADGLEVLSAVYNDCLGPPSFVLKSLACMTDNTLHTIGFLPLKTSLQHIFHHINEAEASSLFDFLTLKLYEHLGDMEHKTQVYNQQFNTPHPSHSDGGAAHPSSTWPENAVGDHCPMWNVLETLSREPFHHYVFPKAPLSPQLYSIADVLRSMMVLVYFVEVWGMMMAPELPSLMNMAQSPPKAIFKCLNADTVPIAVKLVQSILNRVMIPLQIELARAKESIALKAVMPVQHPGLVDALSQRDDGRPTASSEDFYIQDLLKNSPLPSLIDSQSTVRVQPTYRLLILAEQIHVREDFEDSSKKLYKLYKGQIVYALERRATASSNVLKYRLENGWISIYKAATQLEPQLMILSIEGKEGEAYQKEYDENIKLVERNSRNKLEVERFANVSCRRAGFLAFYHTYNIVEIFVVYNIMKAFLMKDSPPSHPFHSSEAEALLSETVHVKRFAEEMIPHVLTLLTKTMPCSEQTAVTQQAAGGLNSEEDLSRVMDAVLSQAASEPGSSESVHSERSRAEFARHYLLQDTAFPGHTPGLRSFSIRSMYRNLRLLELMQALFFEATKRNKQDYNFVLLSYLLSDEHIPLLNSILGQAMIVFQCCFHPLYEGNPNLSELQAEAPFPKNLQRLRDSMGDQEMFNVLMEDSPSNAATMQNAVYFIKYRNILMERRSLALANVDILLNFLKLLYGAIGSPMNAQERSVYNHYQQNQMAHAAAGVQSDGSDSAPFFDPHSLRRKALVVLTRYTESMWTHARLHTLPEEAIKSVVDLMTVVVKAVQETRSLPLKSVGFQLTRERPMTIGLFGSQGGLFGNGSMSFRSASGMPFLRPSADGVMGRAESAGMLGMGMGVNSSGSGPAGSSQSSSGPAAGGNAGAAAAFTPNEDTVRLLVDMGFERALVLRCMQVVPTNDANVLAQFLLENSMMLEDLEREARAASNRNRSSASQAASSTAAASSGSGSGGGNSSVELGSAGSEEVPLPAAPPATAASSTASTTVATSASMESGPDLQHSQPSAQETPPSNARLAEESTRASKYAARTSSASFPATIRMPSMKKKTEQELRHTRDFISTILLHLQSKFSKIFVRLIQYGSNYGASDSEESETTSSMKREQFTTLVMTMVLKVFDKYNIPDGVLRLLQLNWLHLEMADIFARSGMRTEEDGSEASTAMFVTSENEVTHLLHGILHAVIILLNSKVTSGSAAPRNASTSELPYLVLTHDARFRDVLTLLLRFMKRYTASLPASSSTSSTSPTSSTSSTSSAPMDKGRMRSSNWLSCAMLYIDSLSQHVFLDTESIQSSLRSVDSLFKPTGQHYSELAALNGGDDHLISSQVRLAIDKLIAPSFPAAAGDRASTPLPSHMLPPKKAEEAKADTAPMSTSAEATGLECRPSVIKSAVQMLPFHFGSLTAMQNLLVIDVIVDVLKQASAKHELISTYLIQACFQLLVHTLSSDSAREQFIAQQGHVLILNNRLHVFDHYLVFLYTIIQRVVEDDEFVLHSMMNTMKLVYGRLHKSKVRGTVTSSKVYLKSLVEICCPLLQRDARLFLTALMECFQLKAEKVVNHMLLYVTLKDAGKSAAEGQNGSSAGQSVPPVLATVSTSEGMIQPTIGVLRPRSNTNNSSASSAGNGTPRATGKKQRRNDGSASAGPSVLHATSTTATDGSQQDNRGRITQSATKLRRFHIVVDIVGQLSLLIAHKYQLTRTIFDQRNNPVLSSVFPASASATSPADVAAFKGTVCEASISVLSLSDLLVLLADLVASLPFFASTLQKMAIVDAKYLSSASSLGTNHSSLHLVNLSNLPTTFSVVGKQFDLARPGALQSFLSPLPMVTFLIQEVHHFSYAYSSIEKSQHLLSMATYGTPTKTNSLLSALIGGSSVFDSSCYLQAALLSRPGTLRRDVLQLFLRGPQSFVESSASSSTHLAVEGHRTISCFAETINVLLHPPKHWQGRDAFVLMVKDILLYMLTLNYHIHLVNIFNALRVGDASESQSSSPSSRHAHIAISAICVALETMTKKGGQLVSTIGSIGGVVPPAIGNGSASEQHASMQSEVGASTIPATGLMAPETEDAMCNLSEDFIHFGDGVTSTASQLVNDSESETEGVDVREHNEDNVDANSVDNSEHEVDDDDDESGIIEEEEEEMDHDGEDDSEDDERNMEDAHRHLHHGGNDDEDDDDDNDDDEHGIHHDNEIHDDSDTVVDDDDSEMSGGHMDMNEEEDADEDEHVLEEGDEEGNDHGDEEDGEEEELDEDEEDDEDEDDRGRHGAHEGMRNEDEEEEEEEDGGTLDMNMNPQDDEEGEDHEMDFAADGEEGEENMFTEFEAYDDENDAFGSGGGGGGDGHRSEPRDLVMSRIRMNDDDSGDGADMSSWAFGDHLHHGDAFGGGLRFGRRRRSHQQQHGGGMQLMGMPHFSDLLHSGMIHGQSSSSNPISSGFLNNVEQIVTRIIPGGQIAAASFSRMDNNTGAVTLSISRRSSRPGSGASNVQPSAHPLLVVPSDPSFRRNSLFASQFLQGNARSAFGGGGVGSGSGGGSAGGVANGTHYSMNESIQRMQRPHALFRRRAMGPIVSDRRWGTDIAECDIFNHRLNAINSQLESCIRNASGASIEPGSPSRPSDTLSDLGDFNPPFSRMPTSQQELDIFTSAHRARMDFSLGHRMERDFPLLFGDMARNIRGMERGESHAITPSQFLAQQMFQNSSFSLGIVQAPDGQHVYEESKEETELQESKTDDPAPSSPVSSAFGAPIEALPRSRTSLTNPFSPHLLRIRSSQAPALPSQAGNGPTTPEIASAFSAAAGERAGEGETDTGSRELGNGDLEGSNREHNTEEPSHITESSASDEAAHGNMSASEDGSHDEENEDVWEDMDDDEVDEDEDDEEDEDGEEDAEEGDGEADQEAAMEVDEMDVRTSERNDEDGSNAVVAEAADVLAYSDANMENIAFIESLPGDLRREVLETADEDFLQTLTAQMREEAEQYRSEARDIQQQIEASQRGAMSSASAATATVGGISQPSHLSPSAILPRQEAQAIISTPAPPVILGLDVLQAIEVESHPSLRNRRPVHDAITILPSATDVAYLPTITLAANKPDGVLPFNAQFAVRIVRLVCDFNKQKVPKHILKVLIHIFRYQLARRHTVELLLDIFRGDENRLADCIQRMESEFAGKTHAILAHAPGQVIEECQALRNLVSLTPQPDISLLRKLFTTFIFILKKSEGLVWYELTTTVLSRAIHSPIATSSSSTSSHAQREKLAGLYATQSNPLPSYTSYFLQLLVVLSPLLPSLGSNDLELCLQMIEEVSTSWSKISVPQANRLCAGFLAQCLVATATEAKLASESSASGAAATTLEAMDDHGTARREEPESEEVHYSKKRRMEGPSAYATAAQETSSARSALALEPARDSSENRSPAPPVPTGPVSMPFPILSTDCMVFFRKLILCTDVSNGSKKRLMRIMRHFSLYNNNWHLLLIECVTIANDLVTLCQEQFRPILEVLQGACESVSDKNPSLLLLTSSSQSALHEVQLLNVLKLMLVLRARSSAQAPIESLVISHYMTFIDGRELWDTMGQCLRLIRKLEGISTEGEEKEAKQSAAAAGAGVTSMTASTADSASKEESNTISSLTMRFIPLIECFLTVMGTTLQLRNTVYNSTHGSIVSTPNGKGGPLKLSIASILNAKVAAKEKEEATDSSEGPAPPAAMEASSDALSLPTLGSAQQLGGVEMDALHSLLDVHSDLLTSFSEQNISLLNSILKSNIHLLETSFAPLIVNPKTRSYLHFDIKRVYFKSKLKRLKNSPSQPPPPAAAAAPPPPPPPPSAVASQASIAVLDGGNASVASSTTQSGVSGGAGIPIPATTATSSSNNAAGAAGGIAGGFGTHRTHGSGRSEGVPPHSASSMSSAGYLRLHVRRSNVFEESFQALRYKTAAEMRRKLSISFYNEEGMDAGGVTREWYSILAKDMFNPNYTLFNTTHSNIFQPNPQSYVTPDHLAWFKFTGRIIGKAICDNIYLDVHFTRSFYKHILNQTIVYGDLETSDPEFFKSLEIIRENDVDAMGLDLTFSTETYHFGQSVTVDLIPSGRDIAVTESNKMEYLRLIAQFHMTTAIDAQINAFKEGFYELVPMDLISLFDAQELELLISGLPDIDLEDLRANTEYQGYSPNDLVISRFWHVLRGFSQEERALFLQFVTGTAKVPLDGFKALQGSDGIKRFNIHKAENCRHLLPTAHTCFNQLDLPDYTSEEILREKLLLAIREGAQGFGFA